MEKALKEKWILVISGAIKKEIYKKAGLLEEIEAEEKDIELADNIYRERKLHRSDALHAALAILVTRTAHFDLVRDLAEIRKPEDLL